MTDHVKSNAVPTADRRVKAEEIPLESGRRPSEPKQSARAVGACGDLRAAERKPGEFLRGMAAWLPLLACAGLLLFQDTVRDGVREGLALCAVTLIPALFPFMVLSDLFSPTGFGRAGFLSRCFGRLFGLENAAFGIWLTGALCGVPLGARETVKAYHAGVIDRRQAECLLPMAGLCGPAFVIAGVGGGMRKSVTEGVWLFAIQLLASLLSGLLFSGLGRREAGKSTRHRPCETPHGWENISPHPKIKSGNDPARAAYRTVDHTEYASKFGQSRQNLPDKDVKSAPSSKASAPSLPGAIRHAATDMLAVCGSVCLFSAFGRILLRCLPRLPAALLYAFSEVTGGASLLASVFSASPALSFSLSAAAITFGGMSIHLQTALFLEGTDLRIGRYLIGKAAAGGIALGLGFMVWRLM